MNSKLSKAVKLALLASLSTSLAFSANIFAAEDTEDAKEETTEAVEEKEEERGNKIVVTGSRLQKETFDSISPLQVITTEETLDEGLLDTASIVQNAVSSSGQQIDLTFSGFVLDNGPGASTANLRGLGSSRTLVLLNGRRLAPSGVEGAPSAPDLNLIPSGLLQQYDFLTDGASSVYGSDAVAGVVNAQLKKDFDGFEFNVFGRMPDQPNGEEYTISGTWGKNYDRGFIGAGIEYFNSDAVKVSDRRWTADCNKNAEIDENGNVRSNDLYYSVVLGQRNDPRGCLPTRLVGRVYVPTAAGSIYYTPGTSNGGWGNFSEATLYGVNVDSDGDGVSDVSYVDYSPNADPNFNRTRDLYPQQDRLSLMSYGEYTFDTDSNLTAYFEAGYNRRTFEVTSGQPQLFPTVPADNPYNLCNPAAIGGVDCGLAEDALLDNPAYVAAFTAYYTPYYGPVVPGNFGLHNGALGALWTQPIVAVQGDRNFTETEMEQTRIVAGVTADLPWNFSGMPDWRMDAFVSHTSSDGVSHRTGIRQDRLTQGLDAEVVNGEVVCRDTSNGCVPINLFAPSLYTGVVGDFATQAERDFLFDSRDFDTNVTQTLASAFVNGSLATWPAGDVMAGFGAEYRVDKINSMPDDIARDGLFFGFFSDGGASGDRWVREYFAELFLPLLSGVAGAEELNVELSGRYTRDEFYSAATTRSIKVGWRPVSSLLLRATQGTSYRAPNLRELFLEGSTGFLTLTDPCAVPGDAIDILTGGYNPALDTRSPEIFANCLAQGVDPTGAISTGITTFSTEVLTGGAQDISEERSTSETYGFSWEQPFSDDFQLSVGATWYDISIDNTIISPGAQFIINDCYGRATLDSTFCSRITRDPNDFTLSLVDQSFINRDNERVRGVDVNLNFGTTIDTFGTSVRYTFDLLANHPHERSYTFLDEDTGAATYDDVVSEFGYPEWRANAQLGARFGNWRLSWTVRYTKDVAQDEAYVDPFSDIYDSQGTGFTGDTCEGPTAGDVSCADIGYADDYILHSLGVTYIADTWSLRVGARNVFDEEPPFVDGNEVSALNNAPIGYGYDLNGRTFFVSFSTSL